MIKVGNSSIFKWEVRRVLRLKLRDEITQNFSLTTEQDNIVWLKVKTWVACQWQFSSHLAAVKSQVKRQFGEI